MKQTPKWKYDIALDSWTSGPPLPEPRAGGGLAAVAQIALLWGLRTRKVQNTTRTEEYLAIYYVAHILGLFAVFGVIGAIICIFVWWTNVNKSEYPGATKPDSTIYLVSGISSIASGPYLHLMANVSLAVRDIARNSRRKLTQKRRPDDG